MEKRLEDYGRRLKVFGEIVSQEADRAFNRSDTHQISRCYFLKLQNTFNSSMTLLNALMVQDARILLRCLFENMVLLRASARIEHFDVFYRKEWVHGRRRTGKNLYNYWVSRKNNQRQLSQIQEGQKRTSEFAKSVKIPKGFAINRFKLQRLVREFKIPEQYKLFYQHLHGEVHSLAIPVSYHQNAKGEGVGYPNLNMIDITAMQLFWIYLFGLEDIIDVFKLDDLKDRFRELDDERQKNEGLESATRDLFVE